MICNNLKSYIAKNGENILFYGVPGSGKSHKIKELLKNDSEKELEPRYYSRILFHPEFTYSDFVGQILPDLDEKTGNISYKFKPGPFTKMLEKALKDKDNYYFLIIEEINRGNAPAIFGDLFQLLDRREGVSEYPIDNSLVSEYLNKSGLAERVEQITLPKNLIFLATMNTSDQNVFTMDTAFKRRWRMIRVENDFNNDAIKDWKIRFNNGKEILWKDFAQSLNEDILIHCNEGMMAEDKLLGAFFVKEEETKNIEAFSDKVLMYLWNDVVKFDKEQLFKEKYSKQLDKTIKDFIEGKNVFSENCINLIEIMSNENTTNNISEELI